MAIPQQVAATPSADERPRRARRWIRRLGKGLVILLAVAGTWSIYRTFASEPEVGFFRSEEGRTEYVKHYGDAMAQLPAPSATHDVRTDFGVVRVYEWSKPETADTVPVALVPGRSSGVPMWEANLAGFAQERRVLAFDALGDTGLSVQSTPFRSFDDQAIWSDQVLAEVAPEGVHLVGHSFGGATAAAYARAHPERVRSLTLMEPVFTFGYPPFQMLWWATVATLPGMPDDLRKHALAQIGGGEDGGDDPVALMIAAGSKHFSAQLPTPSTLSDAEIRRLTMPTYVAVAGTDSLFGGESALGRAEELLPDGQVQVWKHATHSLPMQAAVPLDTLLDTFWAATER